MYADQVERAQTEPLIPPRKRDNFEDLSDEEIIIAIKEKNSTAALEYLIIKYRNFVRAKARSYFLIGADREDIIQEGMIGFYKAILINFHHSERLQNYV